MSKKVIFQTIRFSISTQFSSIWLIRCNHSRPQWTWEQLQWKGTPHFPKLQHNWNITIRLFNVMSGHSLGKSYPSASRCILQLQATGPICHYEDSVKITSKKESSGGVCNYHWDTSVVAELDALASSSVKAAKGGDKERRYLFDFQFILVCPHSCTWNQMAYLI